MRHLRILSFIFMLAILFSCGTKKEDNNDIESEDEETSIISIESDSDPSSDYQVEDDNALSIVSVDDSDDDNDDNDNDVVSGSTSTSNNYDALLDSYEEYVDQYVKVLKRATDGDLTALTEYPALLGKAQEFSDKMSKAEGSMSAAQWTRYMKITNKMVGAATAK